MPVYIVHYTPLVERRRFLEPLVPGAKWIEVLDRGAIPKEMLDWYLADKNEWNRRCAGLYESNPPFRVLRESDISCTLKHIAAWGAFMKTEAQWALFLEDDALVKPGFMEKLVKVMQAPPDSADMIFIGGAYEHTSFTTREIVDGVWYLKDHPATNCACAYLLSKDSARRLIASIVPFVLPIDFELNYWLAKWDMRVYHHIPYFVYEGTALGVYSSVQIR